MTTTRAATHQPAFAGLRRQAEMLAADEISSADLVGAALARIERWQPELGAFRVVRAEGARAEAAEADRRLAAGERLPLLGVPIAVKDDVDLAGESTPFGCAGEFPLADADSEVVRRLRAAGAVIVGKTATPEFGQWAFTEGGPDFAPARNPWNLDHTPGGSSGGSAAAVAAGLVPAAVGSDGAGSVRIPAAWCGLVGLKPQRGRISTWPDAEAFHGITCFGPLTRTVDDAALLLDVLAGNRDGDRHRPPAPAEPFAHAARRAPGRLRVALSFTTPFGTSSKVDPEVRAAVERTAERLRALGHDVFAADPDYGLIGPTFVPRGSNGTYEMYSRLPSGATVEPRTRFHAALGRFLGGPFLTVSRRAEPSLRRRAARIFECADVVITPTTAEPPLRIGELAGRNWWATSTRQADACPFAFAWNYTGWPALNVPAGFTTTGLPIGAQFLGRENDEATLLQLAAQLEATENCAAKTPQLTTDD
jgi:amidase